MLVVSSAGRGGISTAFLVISSVPDRDFHLSSLWPEFVSFVISLVRITCSWGRPGRRAKGSLQSAATARTADGKPRQKVRRHGLERLYQPKK